MLSIAGQTAGPIGLNLFEDTHGWPGWCLRLIKSKFFSSNFFSRATPGTSASIKY